MSWVEVPKFQVYEGHSSEDLALDEAYLKIVSHIEKPLTLFSLSDDCYKCPYIPLEMISAKNSTFITLDTKYTTHFLLTSINDSTKLRGISEDDVSVLCYVETIGSASKMGEFGVYELNINGSYPNDLSCYLKTVVEPVNTYLSLLLIVLICALAMVLFNMLRMCPKLLGGHISILKAFSKGTENKNPEASKGTAKKRLKSLDTFRGISIILMIFVNYGGGGYWFMDHATWNGLHFADLVFPWFMWIMGVCIPISVRSVLKRREPLPGVLLNVFRRALILFGLGVMLNTLGRGGDLEVIRIFGVLQRFGVAYLVVTTCAVVFAPKNEYQPVKMESGESIHPRQQGLLDRVIEVTSLKSQWLVMLTLLAIHLLLTFLLHVPGCPTGYLGPGGVENDGNAWGCAGGATGYIDRLILGKNHIYQNPTSNHVYKSGAFDPEGIFGCLPTIFHVFLGVQAGAILLYHSTHMARLIRWMSWCIITGVIGAILCLCSKEDGWIPVNKNLWSLSYVMVMTCFAFFLLSVCYILVDVKEYWSGSPFFYPGMNATIMYVGHSIAYQMFPWHWKLPGIPMNTHFINTIEAMWGTGLWALIAFLLFRKKFFLTI